MNRFFATIAAIISTTTSMYALVDIPAFVNMAADSISISTADATQQAAWRHVASRLDSLERNVSSSVVRILHIGDSHIQAEFVTNALRLNLFNMHDAKKDKKLKNPAIIKELVDNNKTNHNQENKEIGTMKKTMKIEGMMCGHCEATVKKALEGLDGVASAEVSHEAGPAVVELSADVADDVLKKTVEDKDYKVTAIN